MKKKRISLILIIVIIFSFLLLIIKSSKSSSNKEVFDLYEITDNLEFQDIPMPYKYIFLRLYDVEYNNPLTPANILKFGVNCTEISDIHASHVAINFSLDDDFYGLSSGGEHQLAKESCTKVELNKFTRKCNPETSNQITFAIRVSEQEYYNIKSFVEDYANNTDIKYDLMRNFKIASFATKRKFFTKKEKQPFGSVEYPDEKNKHKDEPDYKETHFVCSTFVSYCLIKNVPRIAQWFEENNIDYRYVNVSDVVNIPGSVKLFSSKFFEYETAAYLFAEKHPEFYEYLSNEEVKFEIAS